MEEESEGVSLPLFHKHPMIPWNDLRKGDCCERLEDISDGYYCKRCDFFIHKKCGDSSESIQHPSHPAHALQLLSCAGHSRCALCGKFIFDLVYRCEICEFDIDLYCARYHPPPDVIESSETHRQHKLTLLKKKYFSDFDCAFCGETSCETAYGFPYKCHECDLTFHVDCVWQPLEVNRPLEINHSHHSLHPLKLFRRPTPDYSDGKCRLCESKIDDNLFYHCSACNFTLDMGCVLHPPQQSLLDLKTHDHELTLLPRLDSFTCNACGLKGDRSPYVCVQCNFMIHQRCLRLPRVININRHKHRVTRTSVLGVVDSVCGVCRQKVDWKYGGYSCQKCLGYVVHSQCVARGFVWNGKELEGVPEEEEEDIEPYVVIDDNTIQHFSHKEHYLRLNISGLQWEENKRCNGCTQPIGHQSFYGCIDCDFILHQNCAELPRRKRHMLHSEQLTLVTSKADWFRCGACRRMSNGFAYKHGNQKFDIRCGSISEPFVHPSHPHHPLYCIPGNDPPSSCICCDIWDVQALGCIEDDCGFCLDFKCATLPQMVKHRVDNHPLSLCYGEKDASDGKYLCNICEKEINLKKWFYTSKDHRDRFHIDCVLGDFIGLMPRSKIEHRSKSYEVVLNNGISRPFCGTCKSRCIPPIILKLLGSSDAYFCSLRCLDRFCFR